MLHILKFPFLWKIIIVLKGIIIHFLIAQYDDISKFVFHNLLYFHILFTVVCGAVFADLHVIT